MTDVFVVSNLKIPVSVFYFSGFGEYFAFAYVFSSVKLQGNP